MPVSPARACGSRGVLHRTRLPAPCTSNRVGRDQTSFQPSRCRSMAGNAAGWKEWYWCLLDQETFQLGALFLEFDFQPARLATATRPSLLRVLWVPVLGCGFLA